MRCVDQMLLAVPLGLLGIAVGAAGGALPLRGVAGEVAFQHERAKATCRCVHERVHSTTLRKQYPTTYHFMMVER